MNNDQMSIAKDVIDQLRTQLNNIDVEIVHQIPYFHFMKVFKENLDNSEVSHYSEDIINFSKIDISPDINLDVVEYLAENLVDILVESYKKIDDEMVFGYITKAVSLDFNV